jgi:putative two-component system hydrogenase maturation factor HypX/HoxX
MRILFLTHSFNSLAQRLYVDLAERGHEVSIEFDIADSVAIEAVTLFAPDLIVAPYLRRAIPEAIWRSHVCLVVHPGIVGDRGPSALDWAIQEGRSRWGVTVLQANAVMDGGDIWARREFPLRLARKSSIYRNEVLQAAREALIEAIDKLAGRTFTPEPLDYGDASVRGRPRPPMRQEDRRIDWGDDDTATVLRKVHAGDGSPGVLDELCGIPVHLFGAFPESAPVRAAPGSIVATREGAILRATRDGAIWITRLRRAGGEPALKLAATAVLGDALPELDEWSLPVLPARDVGTWQDIGYEQREGVGYLHFAFHNGAMSARDCRRLKDAFVEACRREPRVLVLMGGPEFWSNGIHLHCIEAADSPADASWENIEAMDDLCLAILKAEKLVVAAMQGNAGAGGVFLALAADRVWAREAVVLNPHYKNMGNLYGSEYWTYLLPKRVGEDAALAIMRHRQPIGARQARSAGLIDDCFGADLPGFTAEVARRAGELARDPHLGETLAGKAEARARDEARKPLARYREEELERMKLNFYGFDPSYHVARYHFVYRLPHAWTPLHLARHRRDRWQRQNSPAACDFPGASP